MELAGKRALVTGASRGVGRAVMEALLAEGIHVFGTSRSPDSVVWPEGAMPIRFDASSSEAVERSWQEAGLGATFFDIVVANAGAGAFGSFAETDFAQWEEQVDLLLLGAMKLCRLALGQWSRARPGVLVMVGSLAVDYPIPYMSGYNAAKAGLAAFSESLILETDPAVARVLELRLGDVNTDFNQGMLGRPTDQRQAGVWQALCRHAEASPAPKLVGRRLVSCLRRERRGVVAAGSFFQAMLAANFSKLVSQRVRRLSNLWYYSLRKGK